MILLFLFLFGSLIRTNHILACTVLSAAAPLLSDTPVRFTNLFVLSAEKNIVLLFSFFWRQNLFSESAAHRLFHPCWQNLCHDRFALTLHRYGRPSDGSRFFRAAAIKERNSAHRKPYYWHYTMFVTNLQDFSLSFVHFAHNL